LFYTQTCTQTNDAEGVHLLDKVNKERSKTKDMTRRKEIGYVTFSL